MHSNLTAADVAKYWGCPIIDNDGRVFTNYCLYVNGEIRVAFGDITPNRFYKISDCHLLLKPISELSDDDAVEVAKIFGKQIDSLHDGDSDKPRMERGEFDDTTILWFWELTNSETDEHDLYPFVIQDNGDTYDYHGCCNNTKDIIDYLRSKGYDMDNYLTTNKAKHATTNN